MKLKRMKCMDCAFEFYYDPSILLKGGDDDDFLCPSCNIGVTEDDEVNTLYDFSLTTEIGDVEFDDKSKMDKKKVAAAIEKLNLLLGVPEEGDVDYDKISLIGTEQEKIETLVEISNMLENL